MSTQHPKWTDGQQRPDNEEYSTMVFFLAVFFTAKAGVSMQGVWYACKAKWSMLFGCKKHTRMTTRIITKAALWHEAV